ncbi:MAG TPA: PQQ-binding-like beta-propeller repeat protein [Mycobacteriales bacterium]|jgi:polyvinyl alcohol dehydrogenase (cytochrome)|nr:PQQ-binding-like beta-propeller repeat protein [Mycobacteriales bacterium]
MRRSVALWGATVALTAAGSIAASGAVPGAHGASFHPAAGCASTDWRQYGYDSDHSFAVPAGCSPISSKNIATMVPKWFFHTDDSVTASPAIVGNSVYVGTWDGKFFSLNAKTGQKQWVFDINVTNPVAFGQIVSSAAVVPVPIGDTHRSEQAVIFGGSSSVWALDAKTGKLLASIDLDPRKPKLRKKQQTSPNSPTVEIESSPAVSNVMVDGQPQQRIFVGLDVHNNDGVGRTGVVALRLLSSGDGHWSFKPLWKSDAETNRTYYGEKGLTEGSGQGQGCGDVWSSPAVDSASGVMVYGVGNCDHPSVAKAHHQHFSESLMAVDAATGKFLWRYAPADHHGSTKADLYQAGLDDDFGSSVNIYRNARGQVVAGDGSKGSIYYARTARTGRQLWQTEDGSPGNLSEGFAVGGFIGSLAVASDARGRATQIVGGTAIPIPTPKMGGNLLGSLEDIHSFDATTGKVLWSDRLVVPTYGSASVVNDIALLPLTVASSVIAVDLKTGLPLWVGPILGPPSSTAVVSGSSIYVGTGTNETDLEYKALNLAIPPSIERTVGQSPLSPLSGVQAFQLL